jgi:hypothetical protein
MRAHPITTTAPAAAKASGGGNTPEFGFIGTCNPGSDELMTRKIVDELRREFAAGDDDDDQRMNANRERVEADARASFATTAGRPSAAISPDALFNTVTHCDQKLFSCIADHHHHQPAVSADVRSSIDMFSRRSRNQVSVPMMMMRGSVESCTSTVRGSFANFVSINDVRNNRTAAAATAMSMMMDVKFHELMMEMDLGQTSHPTTPAHDDDVVLNTDDGDGMPRLQNFNKNNNVSDVMIFQSWSDAVYDEINESNKETLD